MKSRIIVTLASFFAVASPAPAAEAALPILTVASGIADGARDGPRIWFASWTDGIGFLLELPSDGQAGQIFGALSEAAQSGRTPLVRIDPASGRYDSARKRIMYRVCAVRFAATVFGNDDAFCRGGSVTNPLLADRALAAGVALAEAGQGRRALPYLDEALRAETDHTRRLIGVRARHSARDAVAGILPASRERDVELVAALRDAREWDTLAPDDTNAELAIAAGLARLGAYDEAISAYRTLTIRRPDERYRSAIRIGAIRRGQGDHTGALAELDGLAKEAGPQNGMRFHYHRGWTLTLLGRDEEAVAELEAGLKEQPDYPWALVKRACAYGRLGRVAEAAADQRAAVALLDRNSASFGDVGAEAKADLARARAVSMSLDAYVKAGRTARTDIACSGYSDPERRRDRSVLLPPRTPAAPAIG